MGRGNICVFGRYEGLFYVDNDDLNEYLRENEDGELDFRLQRDLSYDDMTRGDWTFDQEGSMQNWEETKCNFVEAFRQRFPSFTPCEKWIGHDRDRLAILENKLFCIATADNEWSQAFMLIQKEDDYFDYSGLQKKHYQRYLDAIRDALFEQFESLGTYAGPWMSGTIRRDEVNPTAA